MRDAGQSGSAIGTSAVLRLLVASALTTLFCAHAQVITTVAGTEFTFPNTPLPAINAPIGTSYGVAVDARGNLFVSDTSNSRVFEVDQKGELITVCYRRRVAPRGSAAFSKAPTLKVRVQAYSKLSTKGGVTMLDICHNFARHGFVCSG